MIGKLVISTWNLKLVLMKAAEHLKQHHEMEREPKSCTEQCIEQVIVTSDSGKCKIGSHCHLKLNS